jgi:hypothetical protein
LGIKLAGLSLKIWDLFLWLCSRGSRCCWMLPCFVSLSFKGWSI